MMGLIFFSKKTSFEPLKNILQSNKKMGYVNDKLYNHAIVNNFNIILVE